MMGVPVVAMAVMLMAWALVAPVRSSFAQASSRIVIGVNAQPTHFQPWDTAINNFPYFAQFYNVLVRKDETTQEPQPELAERWSFSPDGKVMTLHLRRDVKFHSGRDFVADDVKRSHARAMHPDVFANLKPMGKSVQEVRVVDRYTVQLVLDAPNPAIFDLLDMLYMIDDDRFDKHRTEPMGSGPYVLADFTPGQKLVLRPFKDYWRKPGPRIQEIEYRVVPDVQASLLQLEAGTIDAISNFPVRDAKRLQDKGFRVDVATIGIFYNFVFNAKQGKFVDGRVRRAFTHAVDRARFARVILSGVGQPLCMPWISKNNVAYDVELEASCDYNLDKAKRLLAEAGHPSSMDVTILTSTQWFFGMTKLAEILQNDWAKIGVNVKLEDVDTAEYVKRHNNLGFEIVMSLTGRAARDPAALLGMTTTWRPVGNIANFESADYDRLTKAAASTLDVAERKRLYRQVNELIRREQFTVPVATAPTLFAYANRIKGVRYSLEGFLTLEHASTQ